jgi:hypothetical protein
MLTRTHIVRVIVAIAVLVVTLGPARKCSRTKAGSSEAAG